MNRFTLLVCLFLLFAVHIGCTSSESPEDSGSAPELVSPRGSDSRPVADEPQGERLASKPFNGSVASIPGVIEAEDFDEGEAGVAYTDLEEQNQGADDYRGPTQVDIEKRNDASGGYGVGWTRKDEWLVYTVSVEKTGVYNLEIPVASDKQGGTFHLEFDDKDVTGPIEVPDTGGWGTLQTINAEDLQLKEGVQVMKIVMDSEGPSGSIGDIDCLRFTLAPQ